MLPEIEITLCQAEEAVWQYLQKALEEAYKRVESERIGSDRHCGCLRCAQEAVDQVNSTIDFISEGTNERDLWASHRYQIEMKRSGLWRILQPGEEPSFPKEIGDWW